MNNLQKFYLPLALLTISLFSVSALATSNGEQDDGSTRWLNAQYCEVDESDAEYYLAAYQAIEGGYGVIVHYADTQTPRLHAQARSLDLCSPEFFGAYRSFRRDQQVLEQGEFDEQSRRQGWVTVYDTDGQLQRRIPYQDNQVEGIYSTYADGVLVREQSVQAGRRHGVSRDFFANGDTQRKIEFYQGSRHGEVKHWNEDGDVLLHSHYQHGKRHGTETRYFSEPQYRGEISFSARYEDGVPVGHERDYHAPGQLRQERIYGDNGEVTQETRFNQDGAITYQMQPVDTPHGAGKEIKEFNADGKLTRHTLESNEVNWNLRQRYNDEGELIERLERKNNRAQGAFVRSSWGGEMQYGHYENGELHGEFYSENSSGERLTEGQYEHGKKVGAWTERDTRQTVTSEYNAEGELHGVREVHAPEGNLMTRETYANGELHGEYVRYQGDTIVNQGHYEQGQRQGEWIFSQFNSRERIELGEFKDNRRIGVWRTLNRHGHVVHINQFDDQSRPHGRQIDFQDNGAIQLLTEYKHGMMHGVRMYFMYGEPVHAERFEDGDLVEDLGEPDEWAMSEHLSYLKHGL